jgi:hypothetical protein
MPGFIRPLHCDLQDLLCLCSSINVGTLKYSELKGSKHSQNIKVANTPELDGSTTPVQQAIPEQK